MNGKNRFKISYHHLQVGVSIAAPLALLSYWSCGLSDKTKPKIVGGFEVNEESSFGPLLGSTVAITTMPLLKSGKSFCSGTLIGQNTVLTAAHCFTDPDGSLRSGNFYVYFGNRVGETGTTQARQIRRVVRHPKYDNALTVKPERTQRNANDIALVQITGGTPAGYSPVPVAPAGLRLPQGLTLAGFGVTGTLQKSASGAIFVDGSNRAVSRSDTGTLRAVNVALRSVYARGAVLFVSSPDGTPKGACPGDSGGPAFAKVNKNWYVTGSLSTGLQGYADIDGDGTVDSNCVGENYYTDARAFNTWIQETKASFGDTSNAEDKADSTTSLEEPLKESSKAASTPSAPGVYLLKSGLTPEKLFYLNNTNNLLQDCHVVVEMESTVGFLDLNLRIQDSLQSSKNLDIAPGKTAGFELPLDSLFPFPGRKFTTLSSRLICQGQRIPAGLF